MNEKNAQNHESEPQPRSGGKGKWYIGLASVAVLCVPSFFVAQHYLTPDVDPNLKAPDLGGPVVNASVESTTSEFEGIPEGSISRLIKQSDIDAADHPLEPVINMAKSAIKHIDKTIADYSANLDSHVRHKGNLGPERHLGLKIRHEKKDGPDVTQFSVYTNFIKPKSTAGQEAIWVRGWNKGNIVAHGAGLLNIKRMYLDPDGSMAMKGNNNPIYDIGMKNLLVQLLKKGEADLNHKECSVKLARRIEVAGRKCTMIEVTHPKKRDHFEFHIARIYMDDELGCPIAYEGYLWPEKEGGELPLLEKFIYSNVKINVGLKDIDFDPANKEYNYPSW